MEQAQRISSVAKNAGVSAKTIRYWEQLGLIPRAARSHTGYRLFSTDAAHYVAFIRKCKGIGLTLAQMTELLEMVRKGHDPCPLVMEWMQRKTEALEQQISALRTLQKRLREFRRMAVQTSSGNCTLSSGNCTLPEYACKPETLCCLIQDLPERNHMKGVSHHEKTIDARNGRSGSSGR